VHGFRIRDLGSTNGTYVDGLRTNDAYLRPHATIRAGATEIRFEPLAEDTEVSLSPSDRFGDLIGKSAPMRALFALLERVAPTEATLLIEGESGTGKELVAHAVHRASARAEQPFVVFDCAAVAANLLESELFGHERGAFTGAQGAREGCLSEADGGTLFLDEIGELPLDLQPKLLRCIERGEFRRIGASQLRSVDVRVIAATNRDLAREVNAGEFREDLYYRLAVVRVVTPPLRERIGDLQLLVEAFLSAQYGGKGARVGAALANLPEAVWTRLAAWPWRGNVRELRNAVARAVALAGDALPTDIAPMGASVVPAVAPAAVESVERSFVDLRAEVLEQFERDYLQRVLRACNGHVTAAAAAAKLDRSYFKRLIKKYGLD
jgi:transcriptional regulator with GAF, ATPase, and Fis domain